MKIGIQTWGSHGDIRPFLALAEGLQSFGHEVSLAITCLHGSDYNSSFSDTGIKVQNVATPVIDDQEEYLRIGQEILTEKNPVRQAKVIVDKLFWPVEAKMYQMAEKLCAENDLVIGHFFLYPLQTAAERADRTYVSVVLAHNAIPSRMQPPIRFPNLGKFGNKLTWWLVKSILSRNLKIYPDRLRLAQGLSPAKDLITEVWTSDRLTLIAVSPELCNRQNDWPEHYQVCGFLNRSNFSMEGQLSLELEEFLNHNDPPIYMTFGSTMPSDIANQRQVVALLSEAAKKANCRAIIQAPLWRECGFQSSQEVYYVSAAPHGQVFPRCQAIVHHGGAGTTQTSSLAGKPSIVVAHIAEQEFWGSELKRVGIAPEVLLRRKVGLKQLATSINRVISSDKMKERAKEIGQKMSKEDGVGQAVNLINQKFISRPDYKY